VSEPFIAEIRMWGCNFPPRGWAFCDGQLLAISQNTALFSLIGTYYGGNGISNFALPNLDASVPMFWGTAAGGTQHYLGESGGTEAVTLTEAQVPPHTHTLQGTDQRATLSGPAPDRSLARSTPVSIYKQPTGSPPLQPLANGAVTPAGGGQPHNNLMPYQVLNFCIALQGIFPARG
jgi:microcystin-dependent protein